MTDDQIESFAIRAALGNNGGTWAEHYTEKQKEHWRQFVRDLAMATLLPVTDEMRHAGADVITKLTGTWNAEPSGVLNGEMADAAYVAMVRARYRSKTSD